MDNQKVHRLCISNTDPEFSFGDSELENVVGANVFMALVDEDWISNVNCLVQWQLAKNLKIPILIIIHIDLELPAEYGVEEIEKCEIIKIENRWQEIIGEDGFLQLMGAALDRLRGDDKGKN